MWRLVGGRVEWLTAEKGERIKHPCKCNSYTTYTLCIYISGSSWLQQHTHKPTSVMYIISLTGQVLKSFSYAGSLFILFILFIRLKKWEKEKKQKKNKQDGQTVDWTSSLVTVLHLSLIIVSEAISTLKSSLPHQKGRGWRKKGKAVFVFYLRNFFLLLLYWYFGISLPAIYY